MSISFDAQATHTVVKLDGVDRVAFNEDGTDTFDAGSVSILVEGYE